MSSATTTPAVHGSGTATTTRRAFEEVHGELAADGWQTTTDVPTLQKAAEIDAGCYRRCPCSSCNSRRTEFRPFFKGTTYMAVIRCKNCGHGEEI